MDNTDWNKILIPATIGALIGFSCIQLADLLVWNKATTCTCCGCAGKCACRICRCGTQCKCEGCPCKNTCTKNLT